MPKIVSLEEVEAGRWVAKYRGNYGTYTIRLAVTADGRAADFHCTCPSDYNPCKHINMILDAIPKQIAKQETAAKTGKAETLSPAKLLAKVPEKELRAFVVAQAAKNAALRKAVLLAFACKSTSVANPYSQIVREGLEQVDFDFEDDDDYYNREGGVAMDILDEMFEKAAASVENGAFDEAVLIAKACLEEYAEWADGNDRDVDEHVDYYYAEHPFQILRDVVEKGGYGLYTLDAKGAVRLLHRDADTSCWHPIPLVPRTPPPVLATALDNALAERNQAVCMVQDVYHGLADVPRGTVKYLRVLEQVPRPWAAQSKGNRDEYDQQHIVITKDTHLGLKVQHGVVPVEPDGSAHFVVPANANIFLQALDERYMAVQTERTFVNYMPGETRACIGCHETPESASAFQNRQNTGIPTAFARKPSMPGAQRGEVRGQRPLHYETDVQPVFDKHCIRCHSGDTPKGKLSLSGERTRLFNVSYESLVPERRKGRDNRDRGMLGQVIGENHPKTGNVHYLPAWSLGSPTALLSGIIGSPTRAPDPRGLVKGHAEVAAKITPEERIRITNWIDTNAQYYGSWWFRRNTEAFRDHPDLRRVPTFEDAVRMN